MAVHDGYLRRTPTELLFPEPADAEQRLADVERAIVDSGADPADPLQMGSLPVVAELLADVRPAGDDPHATHAYAFLLFFSFHLWRADADPWLLDLNVARRLVAHDMDLGGWTGVLPTGVGYLQLPSNLFFVRPESDGPAEPVDGIYWFVSEARDLWVLLASGVRDGRPGFSAVALDRLPAEHAGAWATEVIREEGPDFESTLPGGHLDELYSIETAGEALKLLARVHAHVELRPESVGDRELPPGESDKPIPSRLRFRRVGAVSDEADQDSADRQTTH